LFAALVLSCMLGAAASQTADHAAAAKLKAWESRFEKVAVHVSILQPNGIPIKYVAFLWPGRNQLWEVDGVSRKPLICCDRGSIWVATEGRISSAKWSRVYGSRLASRADFLWGQTCQFLFRMGALLEGRTPLSKALQRSSDVSATALPGGGASVYVYKDG
jgi:hypothetical protein